MRLGGSTELCSSLQPQKKISVAVSNQLHSWFSLARRRSYWDLPLGATGLKAGHLPAGKNGRKDPLWPPKKVMMRIIGSTGLNGLFLILQ